MVELLAGAKQRNETSKAVQACNDYLRMGPGRSLRVLARRYNDHEQKLTPTRSMGTLGNWSTRYGWQDRGEQYDAELETLKTAEADAVMQEGLALAHERVRMLKALAEDLEPFVILGITKKGQEVKAVDPAAVAQLRGTLDDIAKETGGRVIKSEAKIDGEVRVEDHREELQRRLGVIATRSGSPGVSGDPDAG